MPAVTASPLAASLKPSEAELPQITHWISGARVGGSSGRFADVFYPASGHAQARVPLASDAEVDRAIAAAAAAFPEWSSQPPLRRARVMFRFREIFERRLEEVATLINREHGKVLSECERRGYTRP